MGWIVPKASVVWPDISAQKAAEANAIQIYDIDKDGTQEIITGGYQSEIHPNTDKRRAYMRSYTWDGASQLTFERDSYLHNTGSEIHAFGMGDMNKDGSYEIVVLGGYDAQDFAPESGKDIIILDTNFNIIRELGIADYGLWSTDLIVDDVDYDGNLEFVAVGYKSNGESYFEIWNYATGDLTKEIGTEYNDWSSDGVYYENDIVRLKSIAFGDWDSGLDYNDYKSIITVGFSEETDYSGDIVRDNSFLRIWDWNLPISRLTSWPQYHNDPMKSGYTEIDVKLSSWQSFNLPSPELIPPIRLTSSSTAIVKTGPLGLFTFATATGFKSCDPYPEFMPAVSVVGYSILPTPRK
jgi:hypothetical protein